MAFKSNFNLIGIALFISLWGTSSYSLEFSEDHEKDFALKTVGSLVIINPFGSISIQGWAQDKVRVKYKKVVDAQTPEEAQNLLKALDIDLSEKSGEVELSSTSSKGLNLEARWKEKKNQRSKLHLTVLAPSHLTLKVWATNGDVEVKNWNSHLEVRLQTGSLTINETHIHNKEVLATCPECLIILKDVEAKIKVLGGKETVQFDQVTSKEVYVETQTGSIRIQKTKADAIVVTDSGIVEVKDFTGKMDFVSRSGDLTVYQLQGALSGRTLTGSIQVHASEWKSQEKSLIESLTGNVQLFLPTDFSIPTELSSVSGKVQIQYPFRPSSKTDPSPLQEGSSGKFRGLLGSSTEIFPFLNFKRNKEIQIFTQKGNIKISQYFPQGKTK